MPQSLEMSLAQLIGLAGPVSAEFSASRLLANVRAYLDHHTNPDVFNAADYDSLDAALAAVAAAGGTLVLPPGEYSDYFSTPITALTRIRIVGYGATLNPPNGAAAITISQGVSSVVPGVVVEGVKIDGSAGNVIGVALVDTNNSAIVQAEIRDCATAIDILSDEAGGFVEGTLVDNVLLRENTTGIDFRVAAGTGSFAQTIVRGLRCVVGANGIGVRVRQGAILQRSWIQALAFIGADETAFSVDGNMEDALWRCAIEGAAGATGNVGLSLGANATNLDQWDLSLLFTGTIATQLSNASSLALNYRAGGERVVQTTGNAAMFYRRHGDSADRFQLELLTAGPRISGGPGNAARDVNLYRGAANVWYTDDDLRFETIGLGPVIRSPNGTAYRLTVNNSGVLAATAI